MDTTSFAVSTIAGSNSTVNPAGSTDGSAASSEFKYVTNMVTVGNVVYETDLSSGSIRQMNLIDGSTSTFIDPATLTGGLCPSACYFGGNGATNGTSPITTDGTHLYVWDRGNNQILQIQVSNGSVTSITGTGALSQAYGGMTYASGNLYITSLNSEKIMKVALPGGAVSTFAGNTCGSADGTGTAASFCTPLGIATDGTNLYVADSVNNTIRQITLSGAVVTTLAGTAGSIGSTDGTGASALFNSPYGISYADGFLYVTDQGNQTIRKVSVPGAVVSTLAGVVGDQEDLDGPLLTALLATPLGVMVNSSGIFVGNLSAVRWIH